MVISYVLRLRPDALAEGRFVGEVEAVTSRQRSSIRTIEQLAAFIVATMPKQVTAAAMARQLAEEATSSSAAAGFGEDG